MKHGLFTDIQLWDISRPKHCRLSGVPVTQWLALIVQHECFKLNEQMFQTQFKLNWRMFQTQWPFGHKKGSSRKKAVNVTAVGPAEFTREFIQSDSIRKAFFILVGKYNNTVIKWEMTIDKPYLFISDVLVVDMLTPIWLASSVRVYAENV